jgi:hypothetical protein
MICSRTHWLWLWLLNNLYWSYFVSVWGRIKMKIRPAVTKPASTTSIWCFVQKYRKNHTEKSGVLTYEWVKKSRSVLSVLFILIFTVTVSDPRREKKKQSSPCWLQVDETKYTSIHKCRRCHENQEVHAIPLEICF